MIARLLDVLQAPNALTNGRKVGHCAAEPSLVHVKLSTRRCRFLDRFLRLLLAADKQNLTTAPRNILKKISRALKLLNGLIEIDDVNLVALFENERLHLRVPTLGLVTKMDACFQQLGN